MKKINLACIFGAKSAEHEVSIVTAAQALNWIDREKYNLFLIYIDYQNAVYLCPSNKNITSELVEKTLDKNCRIDFCKGGFKIKNVFLERKISLDSAILLLHGSFGEDGKVQGLLDFYQIPYTGSGVLASALGMDKVLSKDIFQKMGYSVTNYLWFNSGEFKVRPNEILSKIENKLEFPVFIKPVNCGSSIGISCVKKSSDLTKAIKTALFYDRKILVEEAIKNAVDINCSVIGGENPIVSVCEQPISDEDFLTFKEKYLKAGKTKGMAGLSRIIPAPLPVSISEKIRNAAKSIFKEFGCWGVVRVDFLYQEKTNKFFPNEINTIPGSLSFYLWKESGIGEKELIDKLINLSMEKDKYLQKTRYNFPSSILKNL